MDTLKDKFSHLPDRIAGLGQLAYNVWWSWHPAARMLFKMLDRPAWQESRHNPVRMLRELPEETFKAAAGDPEYLNHYDVVLARFHKEMKTKVCWFSEN